ncbi:MAG: DNA topoisomerase I [Candidatus Woesearchaeota archaeon]|nr:DNA topoisomerase I [Candidatus Woesearchaeota archaeon]
MTYELIITEKPSAAQKIAIALADATPHKKSEGSVPYYEITHKGKDIVVVPAVGHLYTVTEKIEKGKKKKWTYPVFDTEWKPTSEADKHAEYSAKYVAAIKKLSKNAKSFTVACDYDIEGETIGYNIIRFTCNQKDAHRMKFSTLTKDELVESYEHASPTIDWGQALAGTTRHVLDYYYGINLSRALSLSVQAAGSFKILSSGRVQGPSLKLIVDHEKDIIAFKPVPYWEIQLTGTPKKPRQEKDKNKEIIALHKQDKFWEEKPAKKIYEKIKASKEGVVEDLQKAQTKQAPPAPFDLTTLQTEAYRSMHIQPKDALDIAQQLYLKGMISYPRTSSQQLPPAIGYHKIMKQLSAQEPYTLLVKELLAKKNLVPNNGKKTDPAHPAIFPTGQFHDITPREERVYDIIVRRFFATFGEPAVRETVTLTLIVEKEPFVAKGTRTIEKGWHVFYGPHVKLEEEELPQVEKNDMVSIQKMEFLAKETQPPKRYTPASIIKELEQRGLGTKATRAAIVEALFKRGYVMETESRSLQATLLGIKTCETLEKYAPEILDEKLTRDFEEEMESIREKKVTGDQVLSRAEKLLRATLVNFKKHEKEIGKGLLEANIETRDEQNFLGACPKCGEGRLMIRSGRFGRFAACDKYPACKTTVSLPAKGKITAIEDKCEACKGIMIQIRPPKRGPQKVCVNHQCPSKKLTKEEEKMEKPCPACAEAKRDGKLIVRTSIYGRFLGCTKYPACRHSERLDGEQKEKKAAAPTAPPVPPAKKEKKKKQKKA